MILNALLSSIDLFGTPVIINFSGKEKSKSKYGGLFSLLFFGFVAWASYNGSKDLFSKAKPKIITSETYKEDPRELTLTIDNFPCAFGLQAPDILAFEQFKDESVYKLYVYQTIIERIIHENGTVEEKWSYIDIATENCTPEHFGELGPRFSNLKLDALYCIAKEQPTLEKLAIQGAPESLYSRSLVVHVEECNNETSLIPCASRETLDMYLAGGWFDVYYGNMVINPQNYTRPNSNFQDVYYTMISPANYKFTNFDIGYVEVTTDSGWIIDNLETEGYVKVNKIQEYLQFKPHPQKYLILCTFQTGKLEKYYSRSYKKIQDILAEVGGLANAALVGFFIITGHYFKLKFRESLINELFDVKFISSLNKDSKKQQSKKPKKQKASLFSQIRKKREDDNKSPKLKNENDVKLKIHKHDQTLESLDVKSACLSPVSDNVKTLFESPEAELRKEIPLISSTNNFVQNQDSGPKESKGSPKIDNTPKRSSLNKLTVSRSSLWQTKEGMGRKERMKKYNTKELRLPSLSEDESRNNSKTKPQFNAKKLELKVLDESKHENFDIQSLDFDSCEEEGKFNEKRNYMVVLDPIKIETGKKENNETFQSNIFEKNQMSLNHHDADGKSEAINPSSDAEEGENLNNTNQEYAYESAKINLTIWEYIYSFVYQPPKLKRKLKLLNEGVQNIDQRLDVFRLLKKLREIDKLRALILNQDQVCIYNSLPKPQLVEKGLTANTNSFISRELMKPKFVEDNEKNQEEIKNVYQRLKNKLKKTEIDQKLLEIRNEMPEISQP